MDKNRLVELKAQKELILKQLDWINQEIDRESLATAHSQSPKTSRLLESISDEKAVDISIEIDELESSSSSRVATDLYDQLGPDTKNAAESTRKGCLIIGGIGFAVLAALIGYVVFYY